MKTLIRAAEVICDIIGTVDDLGHYHSTVGILSHPLHMEIDFWPVVMGASGTHTSAPPVFKTGMMGGGRTIIGRPSPPRSLRNILNCVSHDK
jgi:hypothetical protein